MKILINYLEEEDFREEMYKYISRRGLAEFLRKWSRVGLEHIKKQKEKDETRTNIRK
jgi:hypothetical protein